MFKDFVLWARFLIIKMKYYLYKLSLLVKRILLLLIAFQIVRLFFYLYNVQQFDDLAVSEILSYFFFGIRFDYAAIVYYNGIFLLISLLPFQFLDNRRWQIVLKILFVFVNGMLLYMDLGDAVYYEFSNKRTTGDFFTTQGMVADFILLMPQYLKDFWFVTLIEGGLVFTLIRFYPKWDNRKIEGLDLYSGNIMAKISVVIAFLVVVPIFYFLARGFSLKPIRIITAAEYALGKNMQLVLNTGFCLITTISKDKVPQFKYFESDELETIYPAVKNYSDSIGFTPKNVVVIIMESFGKEYTGYFNDYPGYTPFLDSLLGQGTNCTRAFANGRKSIEALPAILSGLPALTRSPFITSQFASNTISGIPHLLKKQGYHTSFFHGGSEGTMGFNFFASMAGVDHHFSKENYPSEIGFDGSWGIYDEEFFQFFCQQLDSFQQPFFSSIFSLSSHHPYRIPDRYQGKFDKGDLQIHESVQYADFALKRFFESAQKKEWFENTLFVITADHTSMSNHKQYKNSVGAYAVPLLFYLPGNTQMKNKTIGESCSHIDIFPTIMDLLNYPEPFISFGQSIMADDIENIVVNYINQNYVCISRNKSFTFDGKNYLFYFDDIKDPFHWNNRIDEPNFIPETDKQKLNAFLQSYSERMSANRLLIE